MYDMIYVQLNRFVFQKGGFTATGTAPTLTKSRRSFGESHADGKNGTGTTVTRWVITLGAGGKLST